jgi:hypothetical protein
LSNGNGVSRGDRNRNARLSRLRELVPVSDAIVGIDLADNRQMVRARTSATTATSTVRDGSAWAGSSRRCAARSPAGAVSGHV